MLKILIIEDNEVDRMAVLKDLKKSGRKFKLVEADNASSGLKALKKNSFDCVILDYHLPDKNALELLEEVQESNNIRAPIIVLTGTADQSMGIETLKYGAQDYLIKEETNSDLLMRSIEYAMERHQLKIELEEKNEKLKVASGYKSEFLANMSHELRSPLNAILLLSRELANNKEKVLHKDNVESAEIIYKCGNDLLVLINNLLDIAKIESGKMTLYVDENRLKSIIDDINFSFRHIMEGKGLNLKINFSDTLPATIYTDQQKLIQIINNLISNSMKFTKEGGIIIDFHRPLPDTDLSDSGLDIKKSIAISITDTGIGIPNDKQSEIFEAFKQADGSTSRVYGGTGLGLSISRELVKLLGGEIRLKSVEGNGSTFTIYIPERLMVSEKIEHDKRLKSRKPIAKIEIPREIDRTLKGKKVLLVDDDMRNLYTMAKILQENGMNVYKAVNGENALNVIEKEPNIDLVLMDVMMPIMDGFEVMSRIRAQDRFSKLPIITVTAKAMPEDRARCISAGADDYIAKPVEIDNLFSCMHRIIIAKGR